MEPQNWREWKDHSILEGQIDFIAGEFAGASAVAAWTGLGDGKGSEPASVGRRLVGDVPREGRSWR